MRTKSGTFTTEYGNDNVTKTVDAVKNVVKKTVSAVKSVVTNVAGKVSTAAKAVTQTVKTVVNTAKTMAGIARTDGLKNALSGLPTSAKATAWQGKVIQAAAKAAIQADNARTAQELAETKAEARQIVADSAGGVYEEFSPRNQKIIDDTVEKVRELLANGASPAEIKRVIRGACTEVAKNVAGTAISGAGQLLFETEEERKKRVLEEAKNSTTDPTALWGTGIIQDQTVYSNKKGSYGLTGSISGNACGAIAVHNANQILGYATSFEDTYYQFDQNWISSTILGGQMGTNPLSVRNYYEQKGLSATLYGVNMTIPTTHDAYIALYSYTDASGNLGAHYVAAEYDGTKFLLYNDTQPTAASFSDMAKNDGAGAMVILGIDKP